MGLKSPQSAGAGWMHQIFPGCSIAIPTSQKLPPVPRGTQLATRDCGACPAWKFVEQNGQSWIERPTESYATTFCVHHQSVTLLAERNRGILTGEAERDLGADARAAARRFV